jgi:hypothetical protein
VKEEKIEISKLNIYQKMSLATNKIQTVAKKLKVGEGTKSEYKAVSEADILNAIKPIEYELGIYSYPYDRKLTKEERVTFKNKFGDIDNFVIRIETTYRFVNIDKPDEFIDIKTYGDGVDSQDKAPGKAMTYADKYALLKAYKIQTGDDPDKNKSGKLTPEEQELMLIYMVKMKQLVAETNTDYEELLNYFNVKGNQEMTLKQLKEAVAILEKKKNKNKEEVF